MADATRIGDLSDAAPSIMVGSYLGTTAAQTITIGFQPNAIIGWNVTTGITMYLWSSEDESNVVSIIATPATVNEGIAGSRFGFALDASTTFNKDGDTFVFIAFR